MRIVLFHSGTIQNKHAFPKRTAWNCPIQVRCHYERNRQSCMREKTWHRNRSSYAKQMRTNPRRRQHGTTLRFRRDASPYKTWTASARVACKGGESQRNAIPYRHRLHGRPWPRFLFARRSRLHSAHVRAQTKPSRRFWKMAFRGLVITRWYLAKRKNVARTQRQPSVPRGTREIGRCTLPT